MEKVVGLTKLSVSVAPLSPQFLFTYRSLLLQCSTFVRIFLPCIVRLFLAVDKEHAVDRSLVQMYMQQEMENKRCIARIPCIKQDISK